MDVSFSKVKWLSDMQIWMAFLASSTKNKIYAKNVEDMICLLVKNGEIAILLFVCFFFLYIDLRLQIGVAYNVNKYN